jgi:hypothetical protein
MDVLHIEARQPHAAFIFGALGSTAQQLECYDQLHRELGAALVVTIPCSMGPILDPKFVRSAVEANLQEHPEHAPVVAHVFGNGGMLLYRHVFVGRPCIASRVSAVIFDSTPGKWFTLSTFFGFSKSSEKPLLQRVGALLPLAGVVIGILRSLVKRRASTWISTFLSFLAGWWAQRYINAVYFKLCMDDPVPAPALYLYSSGDALVESTAIEHIVAERRRLVRKGLVGSLAGAVAVKHMRARCWKDSSHVGHFAAHPEEYRREVAGLLRDALPHQKHRVPRVASLPVLKERRDAG